MIISTYYQMSPKKLLTTILQDYHNIPQDIQRMTVSSAGRDQKNLNILLQVNHGKFENLWRHKK